MMLIQLCLRLLLLVDAREPDYLFCSCLKYLLTGYVLVRCCYNLQKDNLLAILLYMHMVLKEDRHNRMM